MARFETKFISQTLLRSVEMTVIIPSPTIPESLGVADRPASYEVKRILIRYCICSTDWATITVTGPATPM